MGLITDKLKPAAEISKLSYIKQKGQKNWPMADISILKQTDYAVCKFQQMLVSVVTLAVVCLEMFIIYSSKTTFHCGAGAEPGDGSEKTFGNPNSHFGKFKK